MLVFVFIFAAHFKARKARAWTFVLLHDRSNQHARISEKPLSCVALWNTETGQTLFVPFISRPIQDALNRFSAKCFLAGRREDKGMALAHKSCLKDTPVRLGREVNDDP